MARKTKICVMDDDPKWKGKKFYTVSGFSRTDGELYTISEPDIYPDRKEAAKRVAEIVNEGIDTENYGKPDDCKLARIRASECRKGFRYYYYNDADDCIELDVVEHTWTGILKRREE